MDDARHPLTCGCGQHATLQAAQRDGPTRQNTATSNVTDLRRARQRARSVISDIVTAIEAYLAQQNIESMLDSPQKARRVNRAITEIASQKLRDDLVAWLDERRRTTAGRAARKAFDNMATELPGTVERERFRDEPRFAGDDRALNRQLRQIDAGLLYDTELARDLGLGEPLAQELGNDVTRQLRQGHQQGESVQQLASRVRMVIQDGDDPQRDQKGVSGQTKRTKAELIAHDSIQDAYNTTARKRYLRNGFRYAVYDATVDTKTTDLCLRMNEHVIDMRDTPFLIPPLHPYCRSGIRPILDVGDRQVLGRDDIDDGYLKTIMQTKSYRPPVVDQGEFQATPLSREYGHA